MIIWSGEECQPIWLWFWSDLVEANCAPSIPLSPPDRRSDVMMKMTVRVGLLYIELCVISRAVE